VLVEVDWEGNEVWKYEHSHLNAHDYIRLKNGNTLLVKYEPLPQEITAKVKGGIPGSEFRDAETGEEGIMWGDCYQEITPDGDVVWEWRDYEHLDPEIDVIEPRAPRYAWAMNNSLYEMPDRNILVSLVHIDTIAIIEKDTGNIIWRYGPSTEAWQKSPISFQHNPTVLPNGNILLFDNGRHRVDPPWHHPPDFSRIVEINPKTGEIDWEYRDPNTADFHSTFMSGCERLPNRNTLVCEASHGRLFELTYQKEMVWEYVSPFYYHHPSPHFGFTNMIYRAHRYGPDYSGLQSKVLDPTRYETWNRLYAPEAYSRLAPRVWTGMDIEKPPAPPMQPSPPPPPKGGPSSEDEGEKWNVEDRLSKLSY
jgi:hypothetical protein